MKRARGWFGSLAFLLAVGFGGTVTPADIITVAGTGKPDLSDNTGIGVKVNVGDPFGVEIGPDRALYITEVRNHRVLRLDLETGRLATLAGNGTKGYAGDGGPASAAQLNEPYEVRFDSAGNMLFVEMQNHVIRRVDAKTGNISTIAGTGKPGYGGDGGPATKASFKQPHSIVLDKQDNVYIADIGNHRIRKIDAKTGVITSIAGSDERKLPVAGEKAAGNPVFGPRALFMDGEVLWVALREGHSIWKIKLSEGTWQHVAGTGKKGFTGDGGPASEATFDGPKGIAIGADKNLYVVDTENHAIRMIDTQTGQIGTIAGRGPTHKGGSGDGGAATSALLDRPHGICVGPDGAVYIGDTLNHRVRRVK
jgi:DNA-binding beta-propeller fold protein YncE